VNRFAGSAPVKEAQQHEHIRWRAAWADASIIDDLAADAAPNFVAKHYTPNRAPGGTENPWKNNRLVLLLEQDPMSGAVTFFTSGRRLSSNNAF